MDNLDVVVTRRRNSIVLVTAALLSVLLLIPEARLAAAVLLGVLLGAVLILSTLDGRIEVPLLFWVAIFPLGYYFASFPRDRAVITLDRVTVSLVAAGTALAPLSQAMRVPAQLRRAAIAWVCFTAAAAFSILKVDDMPAAFKIVFDGFLLPALLGYCVLRSFDVRRHLRSVHALACVMAVYVAVIGAVEMMRGEEIMEFPGSALYFAGSLPRPHSPFTSDNSFALIGLVTFFFLLWAGRELKTEISGWQRLLHAAGVVCALATALMPLFRSVLLTLLVVIVLDVYFRRSSIRIGARVAVLVVAIAALLVFQLKAPEVFRDRSDPTNFYARIAQQWQTLEIFSDQPWTGVGITNFVNVAQSQPSSARAYHGFGSVDMPHSNLGAVLAETGVLGFMPYVVAQVLLILSFRELRDVGTPESQRAWIYFVYLWLGYWISGLSLTAGYYSDLNLWYMFVLMVLYKYAITSGPERQQGSQLFTAERETTLV